MKDEPSINSFWSRFKTSEELEEFCRPALKRAAAMQDEVMAKARALREQREREAEKKGDNDAST